MTMHIVESKLMLYRNTRTDRALTAPANPPELQPVFMAAWLGLPDHIRDGIAERLPWGGLSIRFADLTHRKAWGDCGSDTIRISKDFITTGLDSGKDELINTIQHELIHFYLGHPLNDGPSVKNELEARELIIDLGLETDQDYHYLERLDRYLTLAKKINTVPAPLWYEAAAILREELKAAFSDKGESVDYLIDLVRER